MPPLHIDLYIKKLPIYMYIYIYIYIYIYRQKERKGRLMYIFYSNDPLEQILALKTIPPPLSNFPTMTVKKLHEIHIVYVLHCSALADPSWRITQNLQQRMDGWKQRSKILVDQIHAVDPHYVLTSESRFIGQASYADIAAGRTSPSSRNCSPYRQPGDSTSPVTTTPQILQPTIVRAQKPTVECETPRQVTKTRSQKSDANRTDRQKPQPRAEIRVQIMTQDQSAEDDQRDASEVETPPTRRGRSPTRKTGSFRVKESTVIQEDEKTKEDVGKYENPRSSAPANVRQETRAEVAKKTLAPREERRGRSPSPMWVPGSTSYADILRGCMQTQVSISTTTEPVRQGMVPLSGESRRGRTDVSREQPPVKMEIAGNTTETQQVAETPQQITSAQKIQVENVQVTETAYHQPTEIPAEKVEEHNYGKSEQADWTDKAMQDYNMLQHHVKPYEDVPRQAQPTEIYDYIIPEPMPELVGFIGSQLGAYPVNTYVYAPPGHHPQMQQQLETINLHAYNNGSLAYTPDYVTQTAYLPATEIYQQSAMQQQQQQHSDNDIRHTTSMAENVEKPVQMSVSRQQEVAMATESVEKSEPEEPANVTCAVETTASSKAEGKETSPLSNSETKGQTFSYAQILSQGLSPRVTPTRVVSKSSTTTDQTRSYSPKESPSSGELSPLQESCNKVFGKDSQPSMAKPEESKAGENWDTMKKREAKKKQQQQTPNGRAKQTDERKSQKSVDNKSKQKKDKLSPPKQVTETNVEPEKIGDNLEKKEEVMVRQEKRTIDSVDTNPSQEKKRRQKRKKTDKSVGDEIDKALKEIENMDKQKAKSQKEQKPKEQIKEQSKPHDSSSETPEKPKDETDKRQSKSSEKFKKSSKSKEVNKEKGITPVGQDTSPSPIKATDQAAPTDNNAKVKEITQMDDSNSKSAEEVQRDSSKEKSKDQSSITGEPQTISIKLDTKIKHKNKAGKNAKEPSEENSESAVLQQSSALNNSAKNKMSVNKDNIVTETANTSNTQKIELENMGEKSAAAKTEIATKQKDTSKKEQSSKSKSKSKEFKSETECNIKKQEKVENDVKEARKSKSPESNKPLTDIEIKNPKSEAVDVEKIVEVKSKTQRKRDKPSKSKVKSEATNNLAPSENPRSDSSDETKTLTCLDNTEKEIVLKTEQISEENKIAEESTAAAVAIVDSKEAQILSEKPKEIVSQPRADQQIEEITQIDITPNKNKKKGKSKDKSKDTQQNATVRNAKSEKYSKNVSVAAESETVQPVISQEETVSHDVTAEISKDIPTSETTLVSTTKSKTVSETELFISTAVENVTGITSASETSSETTETAPKIDSTATSAEEIREIVENGKAARLEQDATVEEKPKPDIIDENPSIKKNTGKSKTAAKEKATKRSRKKEPVKDVSEPAECSPKNQEVTVAEEKIASATAIDSKLSSEPIDKTQTDEKRDDETSDDSSQSPLTGKALIIEKTITTVTTTTSVPGSVKVKPTDFKSVKSVEILENIPLPKIVGSKVTELITLCPETVEASLTTTYARVASDNSVNTCPVQSDHQTNSERVGLTSPATFAENIVTSDESVLFGSVQDRRRGRLEMSEGRNISEKTQDAPIIRAKGKTPATCVDDKTERQELPAPVETVKQEVQPKVEVDVTEKESSVDDVVLQNIIATCQDINNPVEKDSFTVSNEIHENTSRISVVEEIELTKQNNIDVETAAKNIREEMISKEVSIASKDEVNDEVAATKSEERLPHHLLDLVKPYAMNRHEYNQAECNFYRYFKVVKVVKEPQLPASVVQTRPESIVRVVQESVMKPVEDQEIPDVTCKKHALILEAPKYPITSFYTFESDWIKSKSSSSSPDSTEISRDSLEETQRDSEEDKTSVVCDFEEILTAETDTEKLNLVELETNGISESAPQVRTIAETTISNETPDSLISDAKAEEPTKIQQSIHLVSDDSWLNILDEPMIIEDDFEDDTPKSDEVTSATATMEKRDKKDEEWVEMKESQLKNVPDEIPPCTKLIEDTLIDITVDDTPPVEVTESIAANDKNSETNAIVESPVEKINDDQLTASVKEIVKADAEIPQETSEVKATPAVTSSIHLKSDDTWMSLLDEEITIDDDFDLQPEVQVRSEEKTENENKKIEKKEAAIQKQDEEPKRDDIEKGKIVMEENVSKIVPEEIDAKEEYRIDTKDVQTGIFADNEKQSDKAKSQPKKKKESKHTKDAKAKSKTSSKKQNDAGIKTTPLEKEPAQCNLEEIKTPKKKINTDVKEVDKSEDQSMVESSKDTKPSSDESTSKQIEQNVVCEIQEKPKSEEIKPPKSSKKAKKQTEKHEGVQEKSGKRETKIIDNAASCKTKEIESSTAEPSPVVQKQDSTDSNAKSWAAVVGTKGTTETTIIPEKDSPITQTFAIASQDTIDDAPNVIEQPEVSIEHESCEISLKPEENLTTASPPSKTQSDKSIVEEPKVISPVEEKSVESPEQLKEGNKSYAQVAASSRRTSPQISQDDAYLIKPIPLKSDHKFIDVRSSTSDEAHRDLEAEGLQSPSEQETTSIMNENAAERISDREVTLNAKSASQKESIPWAEEIEEEISAASPAFSSRVELMDKPETSTWAAIVGKKSVESPEISNVNNLEQNIRKLDENPEERPHAQVQIYVEETPEQEPIENLVRVDEQGFMEFLNRRELRSRRSRSRSRSGRRDEGRAIAEAPTSTGEKDAKLSSVEFLQNERVVVEKEIKDESEQPTQKQENSEQKLIEVDNDESTKIVKGESIARENVKPSERMPKNKDKAKQKKNTNERKKDNKKQSAEASETRNDEGKITQEARLEQDETFKGKKTKSKKNKGGKETMKRQTDIKERKEEPGEIDETTKEGGKPASSSETPQEIQLENIATSSEVSKNVETESKDIEDRSMKKTQIMKGVESAQEDKNKSAIAPPAAEKNDIAKSKKKSKGKKGKITSEPPIEDASEASKKIVMVVNLEIESPVEPKIDETKAKLEEIAADLIMLDVLEDSKAKIEEIPTEETSKRENIEQQIVVDEITESFEQKMTNDEPRNTEVSEESRLEKPEVSTEQKEIPKVSKAEKRKQKKKGKIPSRSETVERKETEDVEKDLPQNKSTDLSGNANITEDIKAPDTVELTKETVNLTPAEDKTDSTSELKKDDEIAKEPAKETRTLEEAEKSPEKSEAVIEKEAFPQVIPTTDKQTHKGKSKSKKGKRQQDDKAIKSEDTTTSVKEPEITSPAENINFINLSKNVEITREIDESEKETNNRDINDGLAEYLQSPNDTINNIDQSAVTTTIIEADTKKLKETVPFTENQTTVDSTASNIGAIDAADKIEVDASISANNIPTQLIESSNTTIKHSPPLNKLSSATEQSFDQEDKRVTNADEESVDLTIEPAKSKVQFYIADEILVLNPERRKEVPATPLLSEEPNTLYSLQFLSIDSGFWPNKRPYHEAERDHFENLALHAKKSHARDNYDDRHRPRDHDGDSSGGGGGGGRSRDSCDSSRSLLGAPRTERMVADLPGGMCSWSDYSTYLSSESERTPDSPPLGTIEDPTVDSGLSLDYSWPSDLLSSPPDLPSLASQHQRTSSRTESSIDAKGSPCSSPTVCSSSSLHSPDHPSDHSLQPMTFAHLRPQSELHLGRETSEGSLQRCSPNEGMERETAEDEAERIRRSQATVEEALASLQARLSNIEGTMSCLPQDSIESMLANLMTILTELHAYDEEATQLQGRLREIPADVESQRLSQALTGIHTRVTDLLDQAEQGKVALEQAREGWNKRDQEIHTYKLFLDETDVWLKTVALKINEQHSFNTNKTLQDELTSRASRVTELESLPEVSTLAKTLKEALLDVIGRLQQKQQVPNAFQGTGAFAHSTLLRA